MSGPSLYESAFAPKDSPHVLPREMLLGTLAQLRATSPDGFDHPLFEKLLNRMTTQAHLGQLPTITRPKEEWTGVYLCTRAFDPERDSPLGARGPIQYRLETGGAAPPEGAVKEMRPLPPDVYVTPEGAAELFVRESSNWSDASQAWAGVVSRRTVGTGPSNSIPTVDSSRCGQQSQKKRAIEHLSQTYENVQSIFDHPARHPWLAQARGDGRLWWLGLLEQLFEVKASRRVPVPADAGKSHVQVATESGVVHKAR